MDSLQRHCVFIDNCAWDVLFAAGLDLAKELPGGAYDLWITREAEFELAPLASKRPDLKAYIDASMAACGVRVHSYFGFYQEEHSPEDQRVGGWDCGWWITQPEADFIASQRAKFGTVKKGSTRLVRNEADISIAARAMHSIVLTADQTGPLRDAAKQGGRVVFLTDFPTSGLPLRAYIEARC